MFEYFEFNLSAAVAKELILRLNLLEESKLSEEAIASLRDYQKERKRPRGVYLLIEEGKPVYVGKAHNVAHRLTNHYRRLRGRKKLDIGKMAFKAIIFQEGWSTAANEELLLGHYRDQNQCDWNQKGFGPKDPGKHRDGYEPNWFDETYPINEQWVCPISSDKVPAGEILKNLKKTLPYLLRYEKAAGNSKILVDLTGVRGAQEILIKTARALGPSWQLMRYPSHFTLYQQDSPPRKYPFGTQLTP